MLCRPPPARLLQPASHLVFPSQRHTNKAVAAVEVVVAQREGHPAVPEAARRQLFTFCLEKVEVGALRNVWLTAGVRVGDYANV